MSICLDSWAVLRWLEGIEPAAARVEAALPDRPIMSWLNVGEVYYILQRQRGETAAQDVVRSLRLLLRLDLPDDGRVLQAARIKARHAVAYADAFAIATATAYGVPLMTGDPEILNGDPAWNTIDVR